jgi:DHA2 family multidrug resistance protein
LIGAFIANFHSRIFSIGLPDLRGALSLGFDEGAWLVTSTMAAQIFIAPAVVWLATVFGIRRLLIGPGLAYALVSLLIPLARDYGVLVALSVCHGLLLGVFVPATLMIIFRNLPMRWWLVVIAIYCVRVGFTLNFGVWAVGFYTDRLGWEWLYWQDIVLAAAMAALAHLGTPHEPVNRPLLANADWGGMLMFGAGLAMIYAGLDQGNRLDWFGSGTVTSLLISGALLLVAFFVNEALVRDPWASASVLFSRNIGLAIVLLSLFSFTNLSSGSLVPNFLTTIARLRPEQIGSLFVICAIAPMVLLFPLVIYLLARVDVRTVIIAGFAAFAAASLLGTTATHDWSRVNFVSVLLLQSVGQTFTLLSLIIFVLGNSNPARATTFAAYLQVVRLGSAEIGSALIATWVRVREQTHSNLLGRYVESGAADVANVVDQLAARVADHGASLAQGRALGVLAGLVQREANVLAYIDAFSLTFAAAVIALVVVALLGPSPAGPFTPTSRKAPVADLEAERTL